MSHLVHARKSEEIILMIHGEVVEIFVNGRSLGAKAREFPRQEAEGGWNTYARPVVRSSTVDMQLVWDVPYEPGEIKAVGCKNGEAVVEQLVRTSGEAARLEVVVDRTTLVAGGRDVAHLTVRTLDAEGRFVPRAVNNVRFDLSGPARLIRRG